MPAHPGFKPSKSMVYAGVFPVAADEFDQLSAAVERLTLNDASVAVKRENSTALGAGFRCGFLGLLHMEVFHQRLADEYGASVIVTPPTVPCRLQTGSGEMLELDNPTLFPLDMKIQRVWEPTLMGTIITPSECDAGDVCLTRSACALAAVFVLGVWYRLQWYAWSCHHTLGSYVSS